MLAPESPKRVTRARKKKSQKRKSSTIIFDYACARVLETGDSREKKFVFAQSPENGDSAKNESPKKEKVLQSYLIMLAPESSKRVTRARKSPRNG
jgi:hypothetical protein